ncbi:MAG TPA: hypothetical protein VF439_00040 [Candidatus Paceibacterota bacterium]
MKKSKKNVPMSESPLWRVIFYGCRHINRLRVQDDDTLKRRRTDYDQMLKDAGLEIIGQGVIKYSEDGAHGYTYVTGLLQSGAMGHTYPDPGWESVTVVFETCGPVKKLVKRAVKSLRWYLGAMAVVWQELPPAPLQSSVILGKNWKKERKLLKKYKQKLKLYRKWKKRKDKKGKNKKKKKRGRGK